MDAVLDDILPRLLDVEDVADLPRRAGYRLSLDAPVETREPTFVEAKQVDWSRVREILQLSETSNHWANFGPVTTALEQFLARVLGLPKNRCVVMSSSATTALYAVVGLHEFKLGRPLRVVACAYGFFSTNIGPLKDVRLLDSDARGMLSLDALDQCDPESYDAVLVTNLFGLNAELAAYRAFCRARRKILIVDGATALSGVDRCAADGDDEVISFHHTKPWGIGEGGCAIVARDDAPAIRKLLNFGVGLPQAVAHYASNGKISDYASALIIDRLERLPVWSSYYRAQYDRLGRIADDLGIPSLSGNNLDVVSAHLPLVAPSPVSAEFLLTLPMTFRKYYRPLGNGSHPKAERLFAHMVNIPAHSGMAAVADGTMRAMLAQACLH